MSELDLGAKMSGLRVEVFRAIVDAKNIPIPDRVLQRQVQHHTDKDVINYLADYYHGKGVVKRIYRIYSRSLRHITNKLRRMFNIGG